MLSEDHSRQSTNYFHVQVGSSCFSRVFDRVMSAQTWGSHRHIPPELRFPMGMASGQRTMVQTTLQMTLGNGCWNGSVILQYVGTYPPAIPIATAFVTDSQLFNGWGKYLICFFFQPLVSISRLLFAEWTCQSKGVLELGSFGRFSLGDFNHMCILTLWLVFLLYPMNISRLRVAFLDC